VRTGGGIGENTQYDSVAALPDSLDGLQATITVFSRKISVNQSCFLENPTPYK
jgi:hypothetical protein